MGKKKQQTAKHRKQKKKEIANRKAKQLAQAITESNSKIAETVFEPEEIVFIPEETKPVSPARRAFQDI